MIAANVELAPESTSRAGGAASPIARVFFDIGGVLGSNGWDRDERSSAVERFGLDGDDFQYRHEELVGALEAGHIGLDEYLDVTVFGVPREFSRDEFKAFMFAQSQPWPDSIAVARDLKAHTDRREGGPATTMATLNNESRELNVYRIRQFGLRELFSTFFSSCWLGVRKPTRTIYERVLGMTQTDPARCLFIDDREQNIAPARALGMQTIQFRDAAQLRRELGGLGLL